MSELPDMETVRERIRSELASIEQPDLPPAPPPKKASDRSRRAARTVKRARRVERRTPEGFLLISIAAAVQTADLIAGLRARIAELEAA